MLSSNLELLLLLQELSVNINCLIKINLLKQTKQNNWGKVVWFEPYPSLKASKTTTIHTYLPGCCLLRTTSTIKVNTEYERVLTSHASPIVTPLLPTYLPTHPPAQDPLPYATCPLNLNKTGYETVCLQSGSTEYFWYKSTLNISESLDETGGLVWWMVCCLVLAWFVLWVGMVKGIESSGKVSTCMRGVNKDELSFRPSFWTPRLTMTLTRQNFIWTNISCSSSI